MPPRSRRVSTPLPRHDRPATATSPHTVTAQCRRRRQRPLAQPAVPGTLTDRPPPQSARAPRSTARSPPDRGSPPARAAGPRTAGRPARRCQTRAAAGPPTANAAGDCGGGHCGVAPADGHWRGVLLAGDVRPAPRPRLVVRVRATELRHEGHAVVAARLPIAAGGPDAVRRVAGLRRVRVHRDARQRHGGRGRQGRCGGLEGVGNLRDGTGARAASGIDFRQFMCVRGCQPGTRTNVAGSHNALVGRQCEPHRDRTGHHREHAGHHTTVTTMGRVRAGARRTPAAVPDAGP